MHEKTGHILKTWPEPFLALWIGDKRFEFRRDDRGFEVGDQLQLEEWDPMTKEYSGRFVTCNVTYIARGPAWGIPEGYAILSLRNLVRRRKPVDA